MIETDKIKIYLILYPGRNDLFLEYFDEYPYKTDFCGWTFDISKSKKFYNSSAVKSTITKISRKVPIVPNLLEISGGNYQIIEQKDRVKQVNLKKDLEQLEKMEREKQEYKKKLDLELKEIQEKINKLNDENKYSNPMNEIDQLNQERIKYFDY